MPDSGLRSPQVWTVLLCVGGIICQGQLLGQDTVNLITNGVVTSASGSGRIQPTGGKGGTGTTYNYLTYILPGEFYNNDTQMIVNDPFDIAYTNRNQPVQTSDWWTGVGLQWSGWIVGRSAAEGQIGRSTAFISEPFHMQFLDVAPAKAVPGIPLPPHGLRFWNQNTISVSTTGNVKPGDPFDPSLNFAGRGNVAREDSPVVTVGLANVHPLGVEVPVKAPFSNVKVNSYSDWGVSMGYTDQGNTMSISLANGSPFAWMERTQGTAPFTVWAGDLTDAGKLTVWLNQDNVLGLTVTTSYVPFNGVPQTTSTASYVIFADSGSWSPQSATGTANVSMFTNMLASRVAVLAMPHNIDSSNSAALMSAMTDLQKYSCNRISDTKIHYPPIPGSDASVTVNGQPLPLGYNAASATIRMKHQVTGTPFNLSGCPAGGPVLQIVFPHHRKTMIASSLANIPQTAGQPMYSWNGVVGLLEAYTSPFYVRELRVRGMLPYMPSLAIQAPVRNPLNAQQAAREDIYNEMKTWFYVQEPVPAPNNLNSFVRNVGNYSGVQTNTYENGFAALYESMVIADQLNLTGDASAPPAARMFGRGIDPDLGRARYLVAAEMRDQTLQALKELVGQWGDAYSAQFFAYNPKYQSAFGYPDGYGSVQNFNDHHFHYGYFLRAAAMIGRMDPSWLQAYMPMIDQLRRDVATYDRADKEYPFLREFSPFYGHSWANGTSDAGGNDQESTSEAVNFAVGLFELGQLTENTAWRDTGLYMFEEEVLAAEQYWFNQDGDLTKDSPGFYNGNWPNSLVRYTGPTGTPWNTTLVTNVKQFGLFRNTFFGGIQGSYTIQATPLSAFTLYLERNPVWLNATWGQYAREVGDPMGVYDVIVSSLQARLPGTGVGNSDTGLAAALTRINRVHNFFPGSTNAMGKHWAYAHSALGQLDSTIVADTASYAVFKNTSGSTYVAYNPSRSPITVNFRDAATGSPAFTMLVPPFSMQTQSGTGSGTLVEQLTPYDDNPNYFFLRSGGRLLPTPGAWTPPAGITPFPSSNAALSPSLDVVPPRPDAANSTPIVPPDASAIHSWTGTFSGMLNAAGSAFTRFAIYTNDTSQPGWQQDAAKGANVVTVRFLYDFNSDGKPDRVEVLQNVPVFFGNSFLYQSKITEYYFDQIFGGKRGQIPVYVGDGAGGGTAPFPQRVTKGTLTVQIYGGSSAQPMFPVSVSQDTSTLLNRASWVEPPYHAAVAAQARGLGEPAVSPVP